MTDRNKPSTSYDLFDDADHDDEYLEEEEEEVVLPSPKHTCNGCTRPVYVSDVRLSKKIMSKKETVSKSNLYICTTIHKCIIICKIVTQCGIESAYETCTHMNSSYKLA